jgi:hypothetical protein
MPADQFAPQLLGAVVIFRLDTCQIDQWIG